MPDILLERGWCQVLKKTEMPDALCEYAKAAGKKDVAQQSAALNKVIVTTAKVKWGRDIYLIHPLEVMIKEAKKIKGKLNGGMSTKQEEEGSDPVLQSYLKMARTRDANSPRYLVVAPCKPTSGLVLSRKVLTDQHAKATKGIRGKGGPAVKGTCFGEDDKHVFELRDAPPARLAKAIKTAILAQAGSEIRVLVCGGSVNLDDDADQDADFSEKDAPRQAPEQARQSQSQQPAPQGRSDAPARVMKFVDVVKTIPGLPASTHVEAMKNVAGFARQLLGEIKDDPDLGQTYKDKLSNIVLGVTAKAKATLASKAHQLTGHWRPRSHHKPCTPRSHSRRPSATSGRISTRPSR